MRHGLKRKLVLFATGSTPASAKEHINSIWESSIPKEVLLRIPHFYMQSGLNYERMSLADKVLMKAFAVIRKLKKNIRKGKTGSTQDLSKSYDNSSKEYIKELVKYVKNNFFG